MYQSSDFGITAALSMDGIATKPTAGSIESDGNRTSFGLNNLGVAWNVYNSSGSLTGLTVGFAYNRAANFNSRSQVFARGEQTSIVQMFAEQMNILDLDYSPEYLDTLDPFYNPDIRLDEWAAILGYQTGLVGFADDGGYGYFEEATPVDSYFGSITKGGIYEYDFSIGANINNILYLGATLSAVDLEYKEDTSYEENYYAFPGDEPMFDYMWFNQLTHIKGSGFTAKLGAIVRPVEALRIGLTYHLPTYYSLVKSYWGNMGNSNRSPLDTDEPLMDEINFRTAPRLSAGISGVIAGRAILAADYEVAWYNKLDDRLYDPAQTVRGGLEVAVTDVFSLRAGGSYSFDFLKDEKTVMDHPAPIGGYSIPGGVGFNLGTNTYIDLAYVYHKQKYSDYDFFYFDDPYAHISQGREFTPTHNRHMITLTVGTRF